MNALIAPLLLLSQFGGAPPEPSVPPTHADIATLAKRDRQLNFSPDEFINIYYVELPAGYNPNELLAALQLVCTSVTPRQSVVERSTPVEVVAGLLYRIDLREWAVSPDVFAEILKDYPYSVFRPPLIIRADWLIVQLTDTTKSDAYYRLVWGAKPKTRDDALKAFGVSTDAAIENELNIGMIESKSAVSQSGLRWIENRPSLRGYAYGTRDAFKNTIASDKDPLEDLSGTVFKHDGEEWIIGIPKVSSVTGARGVIQVYFLSDGAGNIIDAADIKLVEDSTRFRGTPEIRTAGSCIQCHSKGLNLTKRNAFLDIKSLQFVTPGAEAKIEAFHRGNLNVEITRDSDLYGRIIFAATGLQPEKAAAAFTRSIDFYDSPINLTQASAELRLPPETFLKFIATSSGLTNRIVSLAHGQSISRAAWEEFYAQGPQS